MCFRSHYILLVSFMCFLLHYTLMVSKCGFYNITHYRWVFCFFITLHFPVSKCVFYCTTLCWWVNAFYYTSRYRWIHVLLLHNTVTDQIVWILTFSLLVCRNNLFFYMAYLYLIQKWIQYHKIHCLMPEIQKCFWLPLCYLPTFLNVQ